MKHFDFHSHFQKHSEMISMTFLDEISRKNTECQNTGNLAGFKEIASRCHLPGSFCADEKGLEKFLDKLICSLESEIAIKLKKISLGSGVFVMPAFHTSVQAVSSSSFLLLKGRKRALPAQFVVSVSEHRQRSAA